MPELQQLIGKSIWLAFRRPVKFKFQLDLNVFFSLPINFAISHLIILAYVGFAPHETLMC